MTKIAASVATTEYSKLRAAYFYALYNFAVSRSEVEANLTSGDVALVEPENAKRETERLLKKLARAGLVASEHVNGERELTWQTFFDYQNEDDAEEKATADFNAAFPEPTEAEPERHVGASGPRYTEVQVLFGIAARAAGLSWPKVAEVAGVKSPNYFSKVVRAFADVDPKDLTEPTA